MIRPILTFILFLMFSTLVMAAEDEPLPGQQAVSPVSSQSGAGSVEARQAERDRLGKELQKLQEKLAAMEGELERLRRKSIFAKGRSPSRKEIEEYEKKRAKGPVSDNDNPYIRRTPTPKEIEEYEKKRAKGPVSDNDNPYLIKGPFGTPGLARETYYKKLDEFRMVEQQIDGLRKEINILGP